MHFLRSERGSAVAQMGLLFAAPILTASAVAGTMITMGQLSTEQFALQSRSAVQGVSTGLQQRGTVIAHTDGTNITDVTIDVNTTAGGSAIDLDPAALRDKTLITYIDGTTTIRDMPYDVKWTLGDGDLLLESGEIAELVIDVRSLSLGDRFTIEVRPAHGLWVTVDLQRPSGSSLDQVIQLR